MSCSLEEEAFGNFPKFKVIKANAPLWSVKSELLLCPNFVGFGVQEPTYTYDVKEEWRPISNT